jgi:hypothetical protein
MNCTYKVEYKFKTKLCIISNIENHNQQSTYTDTIHASVKNDKMREETEHTGERRNECDERGERRMDAGGAAMEVRGG